MSSLYETLECTLHKAQKSESLNVLRDLNRRHYKYLYIIGIALLLLILIYYSHGSLEDFDIEEDVNTNPIADTELFMFPKSMIEPKNKYAYSALPHCDLSLDDPNPRYNVTLISKFHKTCTSALSRRYVDNPSSLLFNWAYTQYVCDDEDYMAAIPLRSFSDGQKTYWALLPNCQEDHTLVTLGIKSSRTAEKKLKKTVPDFKMYGTSPSSGSSDGYDKVFKVALGPPGVKEVIVKYRDRNGFIQKSSYASTNIEQFFNETLSLGTTKIDMMFINMEHGDINYWDVLPKLGMFSQFGISICQFNIEFAQEDAAKFMRFHSTIMRRGGFITMRPSTTADALVTSTFFLNVEDDQCVRKYLQ